MTKPIRVFWSELSHRFYASSQYKVRRSGDSEIVTITGQKFDVTDEIGAAIKKYDLEFAPKSGGSHD